MVEITQNLYVASTREDVHEHGVWDWLFGHVGMTDAAWLILDTIYESI